MLAYVVVEVTKKGIEGDTTAKPSTQFGSEDFHKIDDMVTKQLAPQSTTKVQQKMKKGRKKAALTTEEERVYEEIVEKMPTYVAAEIKEKGIEDDTTVKPSTQFGSEDFCKINDMVERQLAHQSTTKVPEQKEEQAASAAEEKTMEEVVTDYNATAIPSIEFVNEYFCIIDDLIANKLTPP